HQHHAAILRCRRPHHITVTGQPVDAVGHRSTGNQGLGQQLAWSELIGLTGPSQRGQHVELPHLQAVFGEGSPASQVQVAREARDPGEDAQRRDVQVRTFALPRLDYPVHLVMSGHTQRLLDIEILMRDPGRSTGYTSYSTPSLRSRWWRRVAARVRRGCGV